MAISRRALMQGGMALGTSAWARSSRATGQARAQVERWDICELSFEGPEDGNPFDIELSAVFECADRSVRVPGFYDGGGVYRVRFSPPEPGHWSWRSDSEAPTLAGHSGSFECVAPSPGNHGPVRVTPDGFHFAYADGTPFRLIGTTAYSWALQTNAKCVQTLKTLRNSPFNKIRMLVFPNVPSIATNPFARTGEGPRDWDPANYDPAYFRRFEDRIRSLRELGIEADLILYHPYDSERGYSDMARPNDERLIRYLAARWGAYRNLWWAMANEYDLIKSKTLADWDRLFEVLVAADPHDRLRSIHQLHVYYDHRKPWITHASVQNGSAVLDDLRAELHRSLTQKPVVFDEVAYEGNSEKRWGNLTGEEMVERFWWGLIGGTYVGHGETHNPDRNPSLSWLGQGGALHGTSAPRLAFLRRIMEEGPAPGIDPIQPWWNYHLAGKPFEYYLKYFGTAQPGEWRVVLPGRRADPHGTYRIDVIDTWNMVIMPVDGVFRMAQLNEYDVHCPERQAVQLPPLPYLAIRLRRV